MAYIYARIEVDESYKKLEDLRQIDIERIMVYDDIETMLIQSMVDCTLTMYDETFNVSVSEDVDKIYEYTIDTINENNLITEELKSIRGTVGQMIEEYYELKEEKMEEK